jgi:predicted transcriptional regulator of viral defense system
MGIGKVAVGKVAGKLEPKGWIERKADGLSITLYIKEKERPLVQILVEFFLK